MKEYPCPSCGAKVVRYYDVDHLRTVVSHGNSPYDCDGMYLCSNRSEAKDDLIIEKWLAAICDGPTLFEYAKRVLLKTVADG